jgi:hypothetical protein
MPIPARMTLQRPSLLDIVHQSKRDFVGKDVQQNTTYSYVWSADQGGHFMLGFVPTFVVHWIGLALRQQFGVQNVFGSEENGILWSAGLVMACWTGLELYDLYDSWRMARKGSGYFSFNLGNLIWNVATALIYFAFGAVIAALSAWGPAVVLAGLAILLVLQFFFVGVWWVRRKIIFQQAGLPYLYRIANFSSTIVATDDKGRQVLIDFIAGLAGPPPGIDGTHEIGEKFPRRHLVITGSQRSGKSSLAAGIGTEFAFNGGIARYTTMSQLAQYVRNQKTLVPDVRAPNQRKLPREDEQEFNDGRILWQWPSVDLLIIDDMIELLFPMRRLFEAKVQSGEFDRDIRGRLDGDGEFKQLLADDTVRSAVVNHIAECLKAEILEVAKPDTFAQFLVKEYHDVLQAVQKIPHVIWVVGDTIREDLFVKFVRDQFQFGPDDPALTVVHLRPQTPQPTHKRMY